MRVVGRFFATAGVMAVVGAALCGPASAADPPPPLPDPVPPSAECEWYGTLDEAYTTRYSEQVEGGGGSYSLNIVARNAWSSAPVEGSQEPCSALWTGFEDYRKFTRGDCWYESHVEVGSASGTGRASGFVLQTAEGTWSAGVQALGGTLPITKTLESQDCEGVTSTSSETYSISEFPAFVPGPPGCDDEARVEGPDVQAFSGTCQEQISADTTQTLSWSFRRTSCDESMDSDGDALSDCREYRLGTDPSNPDTDGGGLDDGTEVSRGLDPLDPSDDATDCSDGVTNDFDALADHPSDPGCSSKDDVSEVNPAIECDDGVDNDADEMSDMLDTECSSPLDDSESGVELTVEFDGPGEVTGGSSPCKATWAGDEGTCTWSYERGSVVSLDALELAPGAYRTWLGCAVSETTCTVTMNDDRTVRVKFDPVRSYAPRAYFSKEEDYGAMDPRTFFKRSSLYWYNQYVSNDPSGPTGCTRLRSKIASAAELTAKALMAGKYRHRYCINGRTYNSAQLTAPAEKMHPDKRPRRSRAGFYLNLPKPYWRGIEPTSTFEDYFGPPMHYERRSGGVVYWFFFAYNDRSGDKHQGDWEHLALRLDERNLAHEAAFYNHLCDADIRNWSAIDIVEEIHPVVFIAGGGHGIWPDAGTTEGITCANGEPNGLWDVRSYGAQWDTWKWTLVNVKTNPWYGAGVGWGKEGGIGWGPLGPGPKKRGTIPSHW